MTTAFSNWANNGLFRMYFVCLAACASSAGGEQGEQGSSNDSTGVGPGSTDGSESSDASGPAGETGDSGSADTTGAGEPIDPFHEAAEQACAVAETGQVPVVIPSGEPPQEQTVFSLGNDFPHRFVVDTTFVPLDLEDVPDGFVCYAIGPGQNDGQDWWFSDLDWRDADNQIHIYMATRGIDAVLYYSPIPSHLDPTYTPSAEYDASAPCPELPRVWTPDPDDLPQQGNVICVLPTSDEAEFVFVRLP